MLRQGSSPAPHTRLPLFWISSLVALSVMFSLGLACATPLAAFAAAAALTSSRRDALVLILCVWFANQLVGFAMLGYPLTANALAWGLALGAAAALAVLAGQWTAGRLADAARFVGFLATGLASFAAYEAVLFVVAVTWLGGAEDFTAAILGWIFVINAAAFVGLLALHRIPAFAPHPADRLIPLGVTAPPA